MGYPRPRHDPEQVLINNQWIPAPWWDWDTVNGEWKCLACDKVFQNDRHIDWRPGKDHYKKCWNWAVEWKNFPAVAHTFNQTRRNPDFKWVDTPPQDQGALAQGVAQALGQAGAQAHGKDGKGKAGKGKGKGKGKDSKDKAKDKNDPVAAGAVLAPAAAAALQTASPPPGLAADDGGNEDMAADDGGNEDTGENATIEEEFPSETGAGTFSAYAQLAVVTTLSAKLDECMEEINQFPDKVKEAFTAVAGPVMEMRETKEMDQLQEMKEMKEGLQEMKEGLQQVKDSVSMLSTEMQIMTESFRELHDIMKKDKAKREIRSPAGAGAQAAHYCLSRSASDARLPRDEC